MNSLSLPALEISNFTYHYKSDWAGKPTLAVKDLNLTVEQGESFGFLGHNGAGKTTTIKAILGLTKPSSGEIRILGLDNKSAEARKYVGYLPEQPYFYDHLTALELVEMFGRLSGLSGTALREAATTALKRTHISNRMNSTLRSLSKGLTQRVAMSQAIVSKPKLLILDEPFSGLDPIGRKEFKDLLAELKAEGTTIFISSHILEDIEFFCDRASIMSQGEVKLVLKLSDLHKYVSKKFEMTIEETNSHSLKITNANIKKLGSNITYQFADETEAKDALKQAINSGISVSGYRAAHGNLEELFVKLVNFKEEAR